MSTKRTQTPSGDAQQQDAKRARTSENHVAGATPLEQQASIEKLPTETVENIAKFLSSETDTGLGDLFALFRTSKTIKFKLTKEFRRRAFLQAKGLFAWACRVDNMHVVDYLLQERQYFIEKGKPLPAHYQDLSNIVFTPPQKYDIWHESQCLSPYRLYTEFYKDNPVHVAGQPPPPAATVEFVPNTFPGYGAAPLPPAPAFTVPPRRKQAAGYGWVDGSDKCKRACEFLSLDGESHLDFSIFSWGLVDLAIMGGNAEIVKRLVFELEVEVGPNPAGTGPWLFCAAQYFPVKMSYIKREILNPWNGKDSCRHDENEYQWSILDTALRCAGGQGSADLFQWLLRSLDVANAIQPADYLLHHAVALGHHTIVHLLLTEGPVRFRETVINTRDPMGLTPLWLAYNNRDKDMIRLLVSHGVDIDEELDSRGRGDQEPWDRNTYNYTLLCDACLFGHFDMATFLIAEMGADVNARFTTAKCTTLKSCGIFNLTSKWCTSDLGTGSTLARSFHGVVDHPVVAAFRPLELRILGRGDFKRKEGYTPEQIAQLDHALTSLLLQRGARLDPVPIVFDVRNGIGNFDVYDRDKSIGNPPRNSKVPGADDPVLLAAILHRVEPLKAMIACPSPSLASQVNGVEGPPFARYLDHLWDKDHNRSFFVGWIGRAMMHGTYRDACNKTVDKVRVPSERVCSHVVEVVQWLRGCGYWDAVWSDIVLRGDREDKEFWDEANACAVQMAGG